jgi:hypothetical protein
MGRETDDGTLEAQYGPVKVWANLGDVPRTVGGRRLAPYGYYVEGPGVVASKLEGQDPIVRADGEAYTYETRLLPPACETLPQQPAAAVGDAPTVGILDMTVMGSSFATTSPDAWERVLAQSAFGTRTKARIRRLRSYEELEAALKGMPTKFLAIINPYGEAYPTAGAGSWRETMEAIRRYVLAGGNWIETGGLAFYVARWQGADGRVRHEKTKCAAQAMLGTAQCLFAFSSEILRPKRVRPSRDGEMILSPETRERIATTQTRGDRALERGVDPVWPLVVDAEDRIWFGGNRLGGAGALWRTGGKDPDARLLRAVVCDILMHQWVTCPTPPPARRARCLVKTHP